MTILGLSLVLSSASLALLFGLASARLCRIGDVGAHFTVVLLFAAAQIVLASQLLSLLSWWRPIPIIGFQIVSSAVAVTFARRHGDDSAVRATARASLTAAKALRPRDVVRQPATAVLAVFIVVMLAIEFVLAVGVAPNNWDSMTYHLARVVYWIQNASIAQFPGATERQAAFPINAEILQGWTILMSDGDRFAQLIQWTAQLGLVAFVFAACSDLGHTRQAAFFAASAMVATPVFVTQSTSTQNDMVLAFFVASSLLFLIRSANGDRAAAIPAGISVGLAVGTKSTALIFLAVVALVVAVFAARDLRRMMLPAACAVAGVFILGSFNYAQNFEKEGSLTAAPGQDVFRVKSVGDVPVNTVKVVWNSTMTLPGISLGVFEPLIADAVSGTFGEDAAWTHDLPPPKLTVLHGSHEDSVGMGLPALLLFLPALAFTLVRRHPLSGEHQRERVAYALAALGTLAVIGVTLLANAWIARFSVTPAALAAPLVAGLATREVFRVFMAAVVVMSMLTITTKAQMKPLRAASGESILQRDRIGQQTIYRESEAAPLRLVASRLPGGGRIGVVGGTDAWEYPYAGASMERTLVKVPPDQFGPGVLERLNLDALLVSGHVGPMPKDMDPDFKSDAVLLFFRN